VSDAPVLVRVEPKPPFNGAAIFAFVLGLIALLNAWIVWVAWIFAVPALIVGILALRSLGRSGARGGLLAGFAVVFAVITLGVAILFFGFNWFAATFG
jgi:hypothetical protein